MIILPFLNIINFTY